MLLLLLTVLLGCSAATTTYAANARSCLSRLCSYTIAITPRTGAGLRHTQRPAGMFILHACVAIFYFLGQPPPPLPTTAVCICRTFCIEVMSIIDAGSTTTTATTAAAKRCGNLVANLCMYCGLNSTTDSSSTRPTATNFCVYIFSFFNVDIFH